MSTVGTRITTQYDVVWLVCMQLKDAAVQHREVQGNESQRFRSCFDHIVTWKGGYVCMCITATPIVPTCYCT